ncbi:MAG TPA: amino acid permease [Acidimicrobiales bacterium]|nr:amino acid permease [Acidimicrobiales bacterium]
MDADGSGDDRDVVGAMLTPSPDNGGRPTGGPGGAGGEHPARGARRPAPSPRTPRLQAAVDPDQFPETVRYRLKNKLLGPPLVTEQLSSERLSRPIALGVLSPDCISSSAYGTEEMLTQLVPYVGLAAFVLVVPITIAILGVLFFVTLSYLDVIQLYTKAGGSYVVARDNFGPKVAQIAAVALLIDYTVTVAVQTAAGTAALTSAVPSLRGTTPTVLITVGVVLLLLYGNLRGIREAGKYFAFPTYFFIVSLVFVIVVGYVKAALGDLHARPLPPAHTLYGGHIGTPGSGLLMGLAFISLLRSFANGGSSLTGLEAISNGVSSFRKPESHNARITLVTMSSVLAFLVLGVTLLAKWTHAVPYAAGSPTVVSQEVESVLGTTGLGHVLFYVVQLATVLILYTGGNTSFNGFPFLANFVAGDSFLPRQLTRRGHRLSFSNGIVVLAIVAILLILVFKGQVDGLVSLYAIGVFTGFTMAGAGMVKHHLTHKAGRWRKGVVVNGFSAFLAGVVVLIFAIAKFTEGAWIVVVVGPLMYWGLIRLHREYVAESQQLEVGAARAASASILRHHVVVVLVDRLDMATARAIQYARTLTPDDLRAVHFDIDNREARELQDEWRRLGLSRLPLDVIECPDRRLSRAAVELVADAVVDGDTECTVLLPRRTFALGWQRLLHDRTADKIAAIVSQVPHVAATIVPYNVGGRWAERGRRYRKVVEAAAATAVAAGPDAMSPDATAAGRWEADDREREGGLAEVTPLRPTKVDQAPGTAAPASAGPRRRDRGRERDRGRDRAREPAFAVDRALAERAKNTRPIGDARFRERVRVAGRVKSVRVQPRAGTSNLECLLVDRSGGLLLVFQGRPKIPGIEPGARLVAEGMVGAWGRRLAILNPDYELVAGPDRDPTGEAD